MEEIDILTLLPRIHSPCRLTLAKLACAQLIAYSLPSHKEIRFLLPALQLIMPFCGRGASVVATSGWSRRRRRPLTRSPSTTATATATASLPPNRGIVVSLFSRLRWPSAKHSVAAMILLQLPITLFFSLYHQRGQVAVLDVLCHLPIARHDGSSHTHNSVLFLTPCHTTPYYSYIHHNISMRFFDCSPKGTHVFCVYPIHGSNTY